MLQIPKQTLNLVALFIQIFIIWPVFDPVVARRDMRPYLIRQGKTANVITVIPLISQQVISFQASDEGNGLRCIMALPGRDDKPQRISKGITNGVYFC